MGTGLQGMYKKFCNTRKEASVARVERRSWKEVKFKRKRQDGSNSSRPWLVGGIGVDDGGGSCCCCCKGFDLGSPQNVLSHWITWSSLCFEHSGYRIPNNH